MTWIWTPELDAEMERLCRMGLSKRQIAIKIGAPQPVGCVWPHVATGAWEEPDGPERLHSDSQRPFQDW